MKFLNKFLGPSIARHTDLWPLTFCLATGVGVVVASFSWQAISRDARLKRIANNRIMPSEDLTKVGGVLMFPHGLPPDTVPSEVKEIKKDMGPYMS